MTEYHYHNQDDFLVQVDYFTMDELHMQYKEMLRSYRDSRDLSPTKNSAPEDRDNYLQNSANIAIGVFQASFRERLNETPAVLSSTPFEDAIHTLMVWASQALPSQSNFNNKGNREFFKKVEDCSDRLSELTSETRDPLNSLGSQPCPWPFVKKVRVYLKSYILSKGLVIADLPGKYL